MEKVPKVKGLGHEKAELAQAQVGAGRGALVMAMIGAVWLEWGLEHPPAAVPAIDRSGIIAFRKHRGSYAVATGRGRSE
jgi:hypothetical protein